MKANGSLSIVGDTQAEAVAHVIARIPEIADRRTVTFERGEPGSTNALLVKNRAYTFPSLRLELLWPLSCANERNEPEPGLPHGRFPYGDRFVSACLEQGVPKDRIVALIVGGAWGANWPNLDEAFRRESRRLTAGDASCDVKIGSHVLKRFRSQRLFWTVDHPTDALIAELVKRLLASAKILDDPAEAVDRAFVPAADGGLLGPYAVPIHPHVAAHFALAWYRRDQNYRAFDRTYTFETYYRALVDAAG